MASFKVGDKVKFLNEVGGGTVVRIEGEKIFVEDETGFDIPVLAKELIRMADITGAGKMFNTTVHTADIEKQEEHFDSRQAEREEKQVRQLREKFTGTADETSVEQLREENRRLQSQVANLKNQVKKLQSQVSQLQSTAGDKGRTNNVLLQYMVSPGCAEVDLHIEKLHDNPSSLSNDEMLQTQLDFFRTCLNHAIINKMKKVIFIHGVGRGVLKTEMQRELDKYNNLAYMDAPISKYGVGATEVYFK